VILPVHNAETTLVPLVGQLLDLLPDLTTKFEILVVDDGSCDQTAEVALDLGREYPQLRLVRHASPRGIEASVKTGMGRAHGEIIIVQEDQASVSAADLRQLWQLRLDEQLVVARIHAQPKPIDAGLIDRLSAWGMALKDVATDRQETSGLHMIRRRSMEGLPSSSRLESDMVVAHVPAVPHSPETSGGPGGKKVVPRFLKHLRDLVAQE
jgi:hypothetical protein